MTKIEELYEQFRALSPRERNERLQALYAAHLEDRSTVDALSIDLLKALAKSFSISVKYQELDSTDDTDAF